MSSHRRVPALLALCAWLLAGATAPDATGAVVDQRASARQLLVMLHLAAPLFRPDINYRGSYDARVGGDARRRVAEALAGKYGLKVIDDWPMPALGVDCFVMEAAVDAPLSRIEEELVVTDQGCSTRLFTRPAAQKNSTISRAIPIANSQLRLPSRMISGSWFSAVLITSLLSLHSRPLQFVIPRWPRQSVACTLGTSQPVRSISRRGEWEERRDFSVP